MGDLLSLTVIGWLTVLLFFILFNRVKYWNYIIEKQDEILTKEEMERTDVRRK